MVKTKTKVIVVSTVLAILVVSVAIIIVRKCAKHAKNGVSKHLLAHPDWYNTIRFPEEHFPPTNRNRYDERVKAGYENAMKSTIIMTGLARDIQNNIGKNISMLTEIGKKFLDYKIVIFENDSHDDTRDIIMKRAENDNHIDLIECPESVSCRLNEAKAVESGIISSKRFEKMAAFRNRCLEHIRRKYKNYTYLLVSDLDLTGPISIDGLMTCLSYEGWDAMSAVGLVNHPFTNAEKLSYYDSLAFVPYGQQPHKEEYIRTLTHTIKTFTMNIPNREDPPVQVTSGFAGCSIYRLAPLVENSAIKYSGIYCEHVDFHLAMIRHGFDKIYINPAFLLLHTLTVSGKSKSLVERILFS